MTKHRASNTSLTRDEIDTFNKNGFLGPYAAYPPEEMDAIREHVNLLLEGGPSSYGSSSGQSRHLDDPITWQICSRPAIVERMADLYGRDLLLWRSNYFSKPPGTGEIPWHQDYNYWPIDPVVNISAWLAIDPASVENSCVQIIPGSHKNILPHVPAEEGMLFHEMADPEGFDTSNVVNMELKAGEFFLFNERTLHRSNPNTSRKPRIGLAIRVTIPIVHVDHEKIFKDHVCILLHGEDNMGFNRMACPPD